MLFSRVKRDGSSHTLPALNARCKRTILVVVTDIPQLNCAQCADGSRIFTGHVFLPIWLPSGPSQRFRNYHYYYSHMVQGKTKGLQSKASTGRKARHAAANTKKGQRTIAPKKSILIKQAALHKVHRASSSSPTSLSNQLHPNRI